MLLEFTAVNSEISAHAWRFESTALRKLRSLGLQFADTTLDTVLTCQNRFVEKSPRIQAYLSKNESLFAFAPIRSRSAPRKRTLRIAAALLAVTATGRTARSEPSNRSSNRSQRNRDVIAEK